MSKEDEKERWQRIISLDKGAQKEELDQWWIDVQEEHKEIQARSAKLRRSSILLTTFALGMILFIFVYLLHLYIAGDRDVSAALNLFSISICIFGLGIDLWLFFAKTSYEQAFKIRKMVAICCGFALAFSLIALAL